MSTMHLATPATNLPVRRGVHARSQGRSPCVRSARRGVLLLVILSLLSLLAVVVITFVIVAGLKKQAAGALDRPSRYGTPAKALLDEVMLQTLRDTNNPNSVLQNHGLLTDLYGEDSIQALTTVLNQKAALPLPLAGPQVLDLPVWAPRIWATTSTADTAFLAEHPDPLDTTSSIRTLATTKLRQDGAVAGCVLTFLSGPFEGQSVRIIEHFAPASPRLVEVHATGTVVDGDYAVLRLTLPQGLMRPNGTLAVALNANERWRVLINGRPFNGTGLGFNTGRNPVAVGGAQDFFTNNNRFAAPFNQVPIAFQVNFAARSSSVPSSKQFQALQGNRVSTTGPVLSVSDEDYDAVDHQNMLLAMEATANVIGTGSTQTRPPGGKVVLVPSLWRPDMAYFLQRRTGQVDFRGDLANASTAFETIDLWNRTTLRPNPFLHPDFARQNPRLNGDPTTVMQALSPVNTTAFGSAGAVYDPFYQLQSTDPGSSGTFVPPPWDVDNDNDGLTDSVWIDPGLPVQTAADGRRYKVLAAILCIDMDGRFNLNAHGASLQGPPVDPNRSVTGAFAGGSPSLTTGSQLITGTGFGPADVQFSTPTNFQMFGSPEPVLLSGLAVTQLLNFRDLDATVGPTAGDLPGRYGMQPDPMFPGVQTAPGLPNLEVTSAHQHMQFPRDPAAVVNNEYVSPTGSVHGYGTPVSLQGIGTFGLDHRGQPLYRGMAGWSDTFRRNQDGAVAASDKRWDTAVDHPYEIRLSDAGPRAARSLSPGVGVVGIPRDELYTVTELERLLRFHDSDATGLPDRLINITRLPSVPDTTNFAFPVNQLSEFEQLPLPKTLAGAATFLEQSIRSGKNRASVTVESADLPVPNLAVPRYLQQKLFALQDELTANAGAQRWNWISVEHPTHITDLLRLRVLRDNDIGAKTEWNDPSTGIRNDQVKYEQFMSNAARFLLAPELLAGRRLNLNRPFGDGVDNNGNGVVDEPSEALDGIDNDGANGIDDPNELNFYQQYVANTLASTPTQIPMRLTGLEFIHPEIGNAANDRVSGVLDRHVRQLQARYLYCLATLLCEPEFKVVDDSGTRTDEEERARLLAQWAVNVVDARDRDHINTWFEYDIHPFTDDNPGDGFFNPWDVDGDLTTAPGPAEAGTVRREVWGVERPELLITETMATHDRRASEDPGMPGSFEQRRRPIGNLLVELYNPQSPSDAPSGDVHALPSGGTAANGTPEYGVALNRVPVGGLHSVWRLLVTNPIRNTAAPTENVDPTKLVKVNPADDDTKVRQVGYFGSTDPKDFGDGMPNTVARFAAQTGQDLVLRPDHYAVVMPGEQRSRQLTTDVPLAGDPVDPAQILRATSTDLVNISDTAGTAFGLLPVNSRKPAVALLMGPLYRPLGAPPWQALDTLTTADLPTARKLRWSISEPSNGYPLSDGPVGNVRDDDSLFTSPVTPDYDTIEAELGDTDGTFDVGTNKRREVVLQRLANPLFPWDPTTNPYLTVDRLPVDLHIYNTEDSTGPGVAGAYRFLTRERVKQSPLPTTANVWVRDSSDQPLSPNNVDLPLAGTTTFTGTWGFLNNTLDSLNRYVSPLAGSLVSVNDAAHPGDEDYLGTAPKNSPWLTTFDRPFQSSAELLLVTHLTAEKLLEKHSDALTSGYTPADSAHPLAGEFSHLPGYLASKNAAKNPAPTVDGEDFPELHRVLEYVTVNSPFVGTEDVLNATVLQGAPVLGMQAPHNVVSRYREPGKVNLNTVFNPDVLTGVSAGMFGNQASSINWQQFVESRRGYLPHTYGTAFPDPSILNGLPQQLGPGDKVFPGFASNPFRSFSGGMRQPVRDDPVGAADPISMDLTRRDIDATIYRPRGNITQLNGNDHPLFGRTGGQDYDSAGRNPYFRYQGLQKLGSIATTRSNVYAVWITIGYFEVTSVNQNLPPPINAVGFTPAQISTLYPDGFVLGAEIGADRGEVTRHRAFYMIDRTIPVGFRKGDDLNVRDCLLLSRYIE